MDTEDKLSWCEKYSESWEANFAKTRLPEIGLAGKLNPDKATNRFTYDLVIESPYDLKTENTPFFNATDYNISPQYAVSFNVKDYDRYSTRYPTLNIIWGVEFLPENCSMQFGSRIVTVRPMRAIYSTQFHTIQQYVRAGKAKKHTYQRRVNDTKGNAKDSYIMNLTWFLCHAHKWLDNESKLEPKGAEPDALSKLPKLLQPNWLDGFRYDPQRRNNPYSIA